MTSNGPISVLLLIPVAIQLIQCYPGSKSPYSPILMTLQTLQGPAWKLNLTLSSEQGDSQDDSSRHLVPIPNQDTSSKEVTPSLAVGSQNSDPNSNEHSSNEQPSDVQPSDGQPSNGQPSDGQQSNGQPSNEQPSDGKPSDGQASDGQASDGQASDGQPSDGQQSNGQPSNGQPSDGQQSNGQPSNEQPSDGQASDGQASDGQPSDGQQSNGQPSNEQPSDGKPSDGQASDGQLSDGKPSDGQASDEHLNPNNKDKNCWIGLEAKKHFETMRKIEAQYEESRSSYQNQVGGNNFDIEMLETLLKKRGLAERAVEAADGNPNLVPAGLNLGGYCMMRINNSILFFHRLKLRNNTNFRINFLKNDLYNMILTARISLNDIHLAGSYERALTDTDPSNLFYTPTTGFADFLLKDVEYKVEGRYRMIEDRLKVEMIISELVVQESLVVFKDKKQHGNNAVTIETSSLEDFLDKLKTDLNEWLKDYFNDYLLFSEISKAKDNTKVKLFDKQKTQALNSYMERVIKLLKERQLKLGLASLKLPDFTLNTHHGLRVTLTDGVLRGVDSMYRRSVATGYLLPNKGPRKVDATIGFSNLKVIYKYKARASPTDPELAGLMYLSSNGLAAHLGLTLVEEPETADLLIDQIQPMKPASLTMEGPANRMIAIYRHLLEQHILAMLTQTLSFTIKSLASLTKCEPDLHGYVETGDKNSALTQSDNGDLELDQNNGYNENTSDKIQSGFDSEKNPKSISYHDQDKQENVFMVNENESMELKVPNQKGEDKFLHIQKIVKNVIKEIPEGGIQDGVAETLEEKDTNADFVVKDMESMELQVPNQEGKTKNLHVQRIEKYLVSERPVADINYDVNENGAVAIPKVTSDYETNENPQESDLIPSDGKQSSPEENAENADPEQNPTDNKFIIKENESMELNVPDDKGNQKTLHVEKIIKKVIQERPEGGNHELQNDETSGENDKADFAVKDVESLEVRVPNNLGVNKNVHLHQIEKYLVSERPGDNTNLLPQLKPASDTEPFSKSDSDSNPRNDANNDDVKSGDDADPELDSRPKTNSDLEIDQNKFIINENESMEMNVPDQYGNKQNVHVQKIIKNVVEERVEGDKTEEDKSIGDSAKADFVIKDIESMEMGVPDAKVIDKNVHVHKVEEYLVSARPGNNNNLAPKSDPESEAEPFPKSGSDNNPKDDENFDNVKSGDDVVPETGYGPETNSDLEMPDQNKHNVNENESIETEEDSGKPPFIYPKHKDKADFIVKDTQSMELKVPDKKGDVKKLHIAEINKYIVSQIPSSNEQDSNALRTAAPNEKNNKGQVKKTKLQTKIKIIPKKGNIARSVKKSTH